MIINLARCCYFLTFFSDQIAPSLQFLFISWISLFIHRFALPGLSSAFSLIFCFSSHLLFSLIISSWLIWLVALASTADFISHSNLIRIIFWLVSFTGVLLKMINLQISSFIAYLLDPVWKNLKTCIIFVYLFSFSWDIFLIFFAFTEMPFKLMNFASLIY